MFKEMFILQNKLNDFTNGKNWILNITEKGKIINWERAIVLEIAELIESMPWKHWKSINQEPDFLNIRIELVDIWHFLMSTIISSYKICESKKINNNIYKYSNREILDNINYDYIENLFNKKFTNIYIPKKWNLKEHQNINEYINVFDRLMMKTLELQEYKKTKNVPYILERIEEIIIFFIEACQTYELSKEELYKLYIGKNVLNQFRQDNGYKEGTYKKIWNGEEDNVLMTNVINETNLDDLSFDYLYLELNSIYTNIE